MTVLLAFILAFCSPADCSDISKIRSTYHTVDSEEKLNDFIALCENSNCNEATPYLASAQMQRAEYAFWPGTKLSYFNEGKETLENYIGNNPNCIEGRYVRLLVQLNAPGMLNYSSNIDEDRKLIENNIGQSGLSKTYQETILKKISQ